MNRDEIMAMGAGSEMDAAVARALGWTNVEGVDSGMWWYGPSDEHWERKRLPPFSTEIAEAWNIVAAMTPTHCFCGSVERKGKSISGDDIGGAVACFGFYEPEENHFQADTMALAICRAALHAKVVRSGEDELGIFPCKVEPA